MAHNPTYRVIGFANDAMGQYVFDIWEVERRNLSFAYRAITRDAEHTCTHVAIERIGVPGSGDKRELNKPKGLDNENLRDAADVLERDGHACNRRGNRLRWRRVY